MGRAQLCLPRPTPHYFPRSAVGERQVLAGSTHSQA